MIMGRPFDFEGMGLANFVETKYGFGKNIIYRYTQARILIFNSTTTKILKNQKERGHIANFSRGKG